VDYLQNHVDWDHLARQAPAIREALNLDLVTNSW
jgi:hypothetical protein